MWSTPDDAVVADDVDSVCADKSEAQIKNKKRNASVDILIG